MNRQELESKFKLVDTNIDNSIKYRIFWRQRIPFNFSNDCSGLIELSYLKGKAFVYKNIALHDYLHTNQFTDEELQNAIKYIDHITDELLLVTTPLDSLVLE